MNWENVMGGAANGATMGFGLGGPAGAIAGGLGGALFGGMYNDPQTAAQAGINPLDIKAEAQALMPSESEQMSQYSAFNQQLNGQIDTYTQQLISSGMDPTQATQIAQNRFKSSRNQFQSNNQSNMANMERGLMANMLPAKLQRDEDILNMNLNASSMPSLTQQMMPATVATMGGSEAMGSLFDGLNKRMNWGG